MPNRPVSYFTDVAQRLNTTGQVENHNIVIKTSLVRNINYFSPPPPLFLASVLGFWGLQTGLWLFAILMAVVVELPHFVQQRWQISEKDAYRLADLTTVVLFISAVYLFLQYSAQGIFILLKWLPVFLLLLLLIQLYGDKNKMCLSVLMWSLRQHNKTQASQINLSYPYAALCLLAASTAQQSSYFWGLCFFSVWALWIFRPPQYSLWRWGLIMLLVFSSAYATQYNLRQLQQQIEQWTMTWLEQFWHDRDPYKNRTAIGDIGELKLSNKILMRVHSRYPLLLRQASYDSYYQGTWRSRYVRFHYLNHTHKAGLWFLDKSSAPKQLQQVKIETQIEGGKAILALPAGGYRLELTPGIEVQQNKYDKAVTLYSAPPLLNYSVAYAAEENFSPEFKKADDYLRDIPKKQQALIQEIAIELDLYNRDLSPRNKIERIADFFANDFSYSLKQNTEMGDKPLAHFLQNTKRGHCEYFASSTVLLLRAAGIPSRYAVGYSVQEYNLLEQAYVVRRRHAHAWALAYIEGQWMTVDTTPANWYDEESANSPWWLGMYDLSSWLKHKIDRWRWLVEARHHPYNKHLIGIALILFLWLVWRIYQRSLPSKTASQIKHKPQPLATSPFQAIISRFQQQGQAPYSHEPLRHWLRRLYQNQQLDKARYQQLQALLDAHYQHRFHQQQIASDFKTQVDNWLQQQSRSIG